MISLNILVPILAALAPLSCSSFAPPTLSSSTTSLTRTRHVALRASPWSDDNNYDHGAIIDLERAGRAAGSALLGFALGLSTVASPTMATPDAFVHSAANAFDCVPVVPVPPITIASSSSLLSSSRTGLTKTVSEDDLALRELEQETREAEKEARIDARKARAERGRKAFYDYDAQQARVTEARIEDAERKALAEEEKDKALAEELKREELAAEREAAMATTKEERLAKQKEAKALLKKEREVERKEKKAERAERVYLAEERREQEILAQKVAAEQVEDQKYEAVEKEYETVAELAKEEEVELRLLKDLAKRK